MALEYTPETVASGFQSTESIERNFEAIEEALADGLSRSGASPNAMGTDLDMQAHRVYNLPNAVSNGEPVTYQQWTGQLQTVEFGGYLQELQTATDGQTTFTLGNAYTPGLGALRVFVNGLHYPPSEYTETDVNTITFSTGLEEGDEVAFVITSFTAADYDTASTVQYLLNDGTYTNVQAQLDKFYAVTAAEITAAVTIVNQQYPPGNVLRYGAIEDGISVAFGRALEVVKAGLTISANLTWLGDCIDIVIPPGRYELDDTLYMYSVGNCRVVAHGATLTSTSFAGPALKLVGAPKCRIEGLGIDYRNNNSADEAILIGGQTSWTTFHRCGVQANSSNADFACVRVKQGDINGFADDDRDKGNFWLTFDEFWCRELTGADANDIPTVFDLQGAANAFRIFNSSLVGFGNGIVVRNQNGSLLSGNSNDVQVLLTAFEGFTGSAVKYVVDSTASFNLGGGSIAFCRFEDGGYALEIDEGSGTLSVAVPVQMIGNTFISSMTGYNLNAEFYYSSFDSSSTPSAYPAWNGDQPFYFRNSDLSTGPSIEVHANVATNGGAFTMRRADGTVDGMLYQVSGGGLGIQCGGGAGRVRIKQLFGLSSTAVEAKNLRGYETFASAGTKSVTFAIAEDDTSYQIYVTGNVGETFWVTNKLTTGFTLNSSNATSTAVVSWLLVR